jgi:hypothetical protein
LGPSARREMSLRMVMAWLLLKFSFAYCFNIQ